MDRNRCLQDAADVAEPLDELRPLLQPVGHKRSLSI